MKWVVKVQGASISIGNKEILSIWVNDYCMMPVYEVQCCMLWDVGIECSGCVNVGETWSKMTQMSWGEKLCIRETRCSEQEKHDHSGMVMWCTWIMLVG